MFMNTAMLSLLAALGLATLAGAIPAPASSGVASTTFTFSQWVEDLIANPDTALTPDQAVEAWRASVNDTATVAERATHAGPAPLRKRVSCNTIAGTEASIPDAVTCINYLAALGSTACPIGAVTELASSGSNPGAHIVGVTVSGSASSSSCNDVARGAGYVMDSCSRADNTVQGSEFAYGNGDFLVWIRGINS